MLVNKSRAVLVTALGTMTPAFLVEGQAKARTTLQIGAVEIQRVTLSIGPEAMKSALLALSPAEKLRLAGDRIRLAKAKKKASAKAGKARAKDTHAEALPHAGNFREMYRPLLFRDALRLELTPHRGFHHSNRTIRRHRRDKGMWIHSHATYRSTEAR
jgi:hypothetical protein